MFITKSVWCRLHLNNLLNYKRDTNFHVCERGQKLNRMRRYTQNIEECEHCGKTFEQGEDYWKDAYNKCYCVDNACGWEDDDTSDSNCTIHSVIVSGFKCEACGSDNIKERSGYKVCFDCGKSH